MNKNFLALGLAAALLAPQVAGAEGFGINEWSLLWVVRACLLRTMLQTWLTTLLLSPK